MIFFSEKKFMGTIRVPVSTTKCTLTWWLVHWVGCSEYVAHMVLKASVPHALQCIPYAPVTTHTQANFFLLLFCDQVLCINMYKQHQKWSLGHWWMRCNEKWFYLGESMVTNQSQTSHRPEKKVLTLESIFGEKIPFFYRTFFSNIALVDWAYIHGKKVFFQLFLKIGLCWTL